MDSNLSTAFLNVPIVGVALGLMFTYLIASLIASAFKEWVASIFEWRGTYLQRGIGVLLSNVPNTGFAWGGAWNWVVAHLSWADPTGKTAPVLATASDAVAAGTKAVNAAKRAIAAAAEAAAPGAAPSLAAAAAADITSATAAATLATAAATVTRGVVAPRAMTLEAVTVVRNVAAATTQVAAAVAAGMAAPVTAAAAAPIAAAAATLTSAAAALAVQRVQTHPLLKGTPAKLPSYVPSRDFATALLELLRDGSANPAFSQVERTVAALPDGDMKRVLSAFIQDAAGDLDKLRARIENWFDDSMDRLSGIYKRFAQYFLLALGVLIAVTMNVDSVHMAVALWQQPTLRGALVAELQQDMKTASGAAPGATSGGGGAKTVDANPADHLSTRQAIQQMQDASLPIGRAPCATWFGQQATPAEAAASAALKAPAGAASTAAAAAPSDAATAAASTARPEAGATPACPIIPVDAAYVHWAAWTILGWLITGFAISLGAPFWFGLLQNIMNLRAAGTPPARADAAAGAASGTA